MKTNAPQWNRPVAYVAWAMFVTSFFLPSYAEGYGYACALQQTLFWPDAIHGNWAAINYELLTFSNLLMLVSPLLMFQFHRSIRQTKWLCWLTFTALVLVWSFVIQLLSHQDTKDLKIGCYVWSLSFALLFYSTISKSAAMRRILREA